jgi:hypothetical protein
MNKFIQADTMHLPFNIIPLYRHSSAPISAANTSQDLPQFVNPRIILNAIYNVIFV